MALIFYSFFLVPLSAKLWINFPSTLFKEAATHKADDKWFWSTPATFNNLITLYSQFQLCHINHVYCSLAITLETSLEVTGKYLHLDVLKCTSKYHCHQQSLIFHWNQPLFLTQLRCHSPECPQDGSSMHTRTFWKWPYCTIPVFSTNFEGLKL